MSFLNKTLPKLVIISNFKKIYKNSMTCSIYMPSSTKNKNNSFPYRKTKLDVNRKLHFMIIDLAF
jgi:hypothetical protein